jgi:WD40 repeat protein
VEAVAWSDDGTRLISCGADGAVYTWDVSSSNRINEVVTKLCPYLGIATLAAGKTSFLTTGDATIQVFQGAKVRFLHICHQLNGCKLKSA